MHVAPYPYGQWPRLSRAEVHGLNAVAGALRHEDAALRAEAERLLGAPLCVVTLAPEPVRPAAHAGSTRPGRCFALIGVRDGAQTRPLALELEAALGGALLDRLLGGDGDAAEHVGSALDDLELGLLAYLAARLCARTGSLELHAMTADQAELRAFLREPPLVLWPVRVELAGAHYAACVWLGAEACNALASHARRVPAPRQGSFVFGLSLAVDAVAARTTLRAGELRSLNTGDVVVPESCQLMPDERGARGSVGLALAGASRDCLRCSAEGCTLVLVGPALALASLEPATRGATMSDKTDLSIEPAARLAALGDDAPVELELCIARFRLTLGELCALAPGQVLDTGQPIGQQVVLRAAGSAVAEGELVDVDGRVGVRITQLQSA